MGGNRQKGQGQVHRQVPICLPGMGATEPATRLNRKEKTNMPLTTTAKKPVVHGQYNRNGYEVWLWGSHCLHGLHIERCDACQQFANHQIAADAMEKAAHAQPALLKFVEEIAGLKHESEPAEDGKSFDIPSED